MAVAPVVGAWTPRAHGAREGRVRGFLGGALRCLADSEAPPKKNKINKQAPRQKINKNWRGCPWVKKLSLGRCLAADVYSWSFAEVVGFWFLSTANEVDQGF